jgi:hypothetical protein
VKTSFQRLTAVFLAAQLILIPASRAAMVPQTSAVDGERVAVVVDRNDLRAKLEARGVREADVLGRVEALTDAEATELSAQIDSLPAGGNPLAFLFYVMVAIVAVPVIIIGAVFKALVAKR